MEGKETVKHLFQITWSKDQTLRLWRVDTLIQSQCGADLGDDDIDDSGITMSRSNSSADGDNADSSESTKDEDEEDEEEDPKSPGSGREQAEDSNNSKGTQVCIT